MRRATRPPGEPETLQNYKRLYPEDDVASGEEAKNIWGRFRSDQAYQDIRDALIQAQGCLCGYCEQRLSRADGSLVTLDQQIEHILPKSGSTGRTLDWSNLMLCCSGGTYKHFEDSTRYLKGRHNVSCGQSKDDEELGSHCDPRGFPDSGLVQVDLRGKISAADEACRTHGVNPDTLNDTLNRVLNLNCERLRVARREVIDNVLWLVDEVARELMGTSHLTPEQLEQYWDLVVAGRLQPDKHGHLHSFWTTERQYLEFTVEQPPQF